MSLTITTWNVQNFTRNDAVYADKLNYIATTILHSDPILSLSKKYWTKEH
ncbi:MAG: hypothetical protein NTNFB02_10990 [Nitrospira sp.]